MKIWKLTARFVETVTKDGLYSDGGNLYLQVRDRGKAKSWIFLYTSRRDKQKHYMGLDSAATVPLAMARERAQECRQLLHDGKDPLEESRAKKRAHEAKFGLAQTVEQLSDKYYATKIANKSPNYKKSAMRMLVHINRTIGKLPVVEVTSAIIRDKTELGKWWVDKHPQAKHLLSHLKRMFSMAMAEGTIAVNPAAFVDNLQHLLPDHVHKVDHFSSLDHRELPCFMAGLRSYEDRSARKTGHTISAYAVEFVILTGGRANEVCRAQWKEIDFDREIWNVPPDHLKTGHRHGKTCRRPITKSMMDVLRIMERRYHSPDDLVFPSDYASQLSVPTLRATIAGLGWPINITTHGFRSTFTDWARARRYPRDWIDAQLDHLPPGQVWQAYARDDLLSERRNMMQEYDAYASRPEPHAGLNVIPMRRANA
jgi:integrase